MIDYFQNKNISAKNYIRDCLGVDPSSSKYQELFRKVSAKYYCIADLLQADMIESGDGTILILNGHTNTSYYNYAKILSYDAQRHVFFRLHQRTALFPFHRIVAVGTAAVLITCETLTFAYCIHVILRQLKFWIRQQWSGHLRRYFKDPEADISFNQESYSHNMARSCFTLNSLSENRAFCHDG